MIYNIINSLMEITPIAKETRQLFNNYKDILQLIEIQTFEDYYILHIALNTYPITITTDFDNYCYLSSEILNLELLNIEFMCKNKKTPEFIIQKIINYDFTNCFSNIENDNSSNSFMIESQDNFNIFRKIDNLTKFPIDYKKLYNDSLFFRKNNSMINIKNIPKELLPRPDSIYTIITNEIKQINSNMSYKHYIIPNKNNVYNLRVRTFYENQIMNKVKEIYDIDYIEMDFILEPLVYPYIAPTINIIKPNVSYQLVNSIMNLSILKQINWTSTISLEWLITNLVKELSKHIDSHIILDNSSDNQLKNSIQMLYSFDSKNSEGSELIVLSYGDKMKNKSSNSSNQVQHSKDYFVSGTGYSNNHSKAWDINDFIKQQDIINDKIVQCLKDISLQINKENEKIIFETKLSEYLIKSIKDITVLEINKNITLYGQIFNILLKMIDIIKNDEFIKSVSDIINVLQDPIISIINMNTINNTELELYKIIQNTIEKYVSLNKKNNVVQKSIVPKSIKDQYEMEMKKLQFGTYEIPKNHLFIKNISNKPENKAIIRMISEISTFKNNLPLNWDSTIWVRVSQKNMNVFSFFISGPKNTPYENGIFEFHATFPNNYPNSQPEVLINTTGGGKFRFNPNLYANGKVCLSLLGTWGGHESEQWNPKTSTMLQVLVSIQSLILITEPYFNEPGYQVEINTPRGKVNSDRYNHVIYPETVKLAINDMIKNPPVGMEEVIKLHFKLKKNEIINTTDKWLMDFKNDGHTKASYSYFEKIRNEMIELLNNL